MGHGFHSYVKQPAGIYVYIYIILSGCIIMIQQPEHSCSHTSIWRHGEVIVIHPNIILRFLKMENPQVTTDLNTKIG